MKTPQDPDSATPKPLGPPIRPPAAEPRGKPTENPRVWQRPDGKLETRIPDNEGARLRKALPPGQSIKWLCSCDMLQPLDFSAACPYCDVPYWRRGAL